MIQDSKTWVNRISYIKELEILFRDAEWNDDADEANRLHDIINLQRNLLVLDGELIVPF